MQLQCLLEDEVPDSNTEKSNPKSMTPVTPNEIPSGINIVSLNIFFFILASGTSQIRL